MRTRFVKMLVLDEADEMLNHGFKEQIYDVYRHLPPSTQVVLLSATLPHEILEMTSKFMTEPIRILVKRYLVLLPIILSAEKGCSFTNLLYLCNPEDRGNVVGEFFGH